MPPKRTAGPPSKRTQATTGAPRKAPVAARDEESDNPFASSDEEAAVSSHQKKRARASGQAAGNRGDDDDQDDVRAAGAGAVQEEEEPDKTIPKELLTRLLHEFFTKDATRISRDANATVGKYFDVFVREAIARTAVERQSGFLEVEDLEKVTPQLLLDL